MRILITAGPTREPLDPVRYLSNRSSGKMGYALAAAASEKGHAVTLISGPVALKAPDGVTLHLVETAQEMWEMTRHVTTAGKVDIAVLAAAVADYRPRLVEAHKIKKSAATLTLELERTPDILGSMRSTFGYKGFLAGFAAETENLALNALDKLKRKKCDLIIANDVSRSDTGFDSDDNEVILCHSSGRTEPLPRQSKQELSRLIVSKIVALAKEKLIAGS